MQNSNWEKCKLKSICKNICSGGTPKSTESSFYGGNIPWLRTQEVNFQNIYSTGINITNAGLEHSAAKWVPTNTVIVAMYGNSAGRSAITKIPLTTNQACCCFQIDERQADYRYVYNFLKLNYLQIKDMANGGAQQNLNSLILKNLDISLPPLDEQKRIAEVLGAFDDKIELLQKQNKTLEDMAKALFKSWFVDFDVVRAKQKGLPKADIMREYHLTDELYDLFPSSFADSPLGPIPSGWEVKTIQDLGEVVCGKTPSTSHKEYYGGSVPFITIPDMHNSIFANKTERYLTIQGEQAQPTKTLPPFSVCVSCIATPGLVTMTTANSQTNQQINSVIPHNLEAKFYNYYVLRSVADQIRAQGSGGSVFVNLNKTAFSKIKVLWADQSLQKLFTKESESYFNKILNNLKQIQTLTELRDTLLPRLISGKIRV